MTISWFLAALSAFICCSCCSASLVDENNNIRRLPGDLKPSSYAIYIHPYFDAPDVIFDPEKNQTFDGAVGINVTVIEPTSTIILNAKNLTFSNLTKYNVFSYTNDEFIATIDFFLTLENHTVTIELERELEVDENIDKPGDVVYVTQFETTKARFVFPSFDEPDYKATFEITIVKPKAWVALSNTLNVSTIDIGNGYEEVKFEETEVMSTYLVAMGIGDLVKIEGFTADNILTRVWSLHSGEDKIKAALNSAIKCTNAMTKYTNFKLPLKKIDHLAVPLLGGGMENFGLIVYEEDAVLFNPLNDDRLSEWISTTNMICHELSHHWFGDVVTNKWWGDLFLHEGFASFFENKAIALAYPKEKAYMDFIVAQSEAFNLGINAGVSSYTHPIITQNGDFGYITYDMGAAVIRQLEAVISAKTFQNGLQNYIHKYQYTNANYQQLLDEIQVAVDETNLKDWCAESFNVTKFMDLWLNQKGHPNLHIDYTDDGTFVITQNVQNGTDEKLWPLPVFVQLKNDKKRLYWSAPNYVCKNGKTLPRILEIKTSALLINRDLLGVTDVTYSSNAIQAIADALTSFPADLQLSPASLFAFLTDAVKSATTNGIPKQHLKNIIENIFMHQNNAFSLGIIEEFTNKIKAWLEEGRFENAIAKSLPMK